MVRAQVIFVGISLGTALVCTQPALAQSEARWSSLALFLGSLPANEGLLRTHLEARAEALRAGDEEQAHLALGLFEEAKEALGAPNAVVAAASLVEEAKDFRADGELERAIQGVRRALRLAPDLLSAHWLHIALLVQDNPARLARIFPALTSMTSAWIRSFRNQVHLAGLIGIAFWLGVLIASVMTALVVFGRYSRYQAYDFAKCMPRVLGTGEVQLLMAVAILLPLVLGFGVLTALVLTLGLSLAYQSRAERVLSGFVLLMVGLTPLIIAGLAPLLVFNGSRIDHMTSVLEEAFADRALVALRQHIERHPSDSLGSYVLGVRAARRSDWRRASEHFLAAETTRSTAGVLNNLGVLAYRVGDHEAAEAYLLRAIRKGGWAQPSFNLGLIRQARGDMESAQQLLGQARDIAPSVIAMTEADRAEAIEKRFLWIWVSSVQLWGGLYNLDTSELGVTQTQLWQFVGGFMPVWVMPVWVLFVLLLGVQSFRIEVKSAACIRCGAPAIASESPLHCTQCQSIFTSSKAVSFTARQAKEREVAGHRWRTRWLERFAAVVPGLINLVSGRPGRGFAELTVFCVLASLFLTRSSLRFHAWHLPDGGETEAAFGFGILLLLGVLSLVSIRRYAMGR